MPRLLTDVRDYLPNMNSQISELITVLLSPGRFCTDAPHLFLLRIIDGFIGFSSIRFQVCLEESDVNEKITFELSDEKYLNRIFFREPIRFKKSEGSRVHC